MFSRRRGSTKAKTPLDSSTSTAATAAGQLAFLQHSGSTPTLLSSAAAAAALRSHTSTPEPVGSLQTKRLIRKNSVSSQNSGSMVGANGRPGLVRTNSNGSMTERTFRAPSPARWNASSPTNDVPPVPALPQTVNRPSSSMGAPQRVVSPTPAQGQRSSSVDDAAYGPAGNSQYSKRLSNVAERDELDRAHRDFAKNFSRRDISPPASPTGLSRQDDQSAAGANNNYTQGMGSWYTQNTGGRAPTRSRASEVVSPSTRSSSMSSLTLPPTQPLRGTQPVSAAGRHYGQQRFYGIPPPTNNAPQTKVYDPNSRTFVTKPIAQQPVPPALQAARRAKSMETVYDPNSRTFVPKFPPTSRNESASSSPRSIASEPPRASVPRKQRSFPVGNTSPEPPARNPARFSSFTIVPSATSRNAATLHKQPSMVREESETDATSLPREPTNGTRAAQSTVLPPKTYVAPRDVHQRSTSLDVPRDGSGRGRNVSYSPQRSAHFSSSPVLEPEIHAPPPRDLSPAKSAMKQSPSIRPTSPMAVVTGPSSEASETPSLSALDGISGKKKKSARVSFDEQPQEIGIATTTLSSSTRALSPEVSEDVDDDGMMKPRPALPSFGSVRRDRLQSVPAEKVTEMPPERHEVSSDHAVGGILRNSLDPLPPEVTSKETAGYVSDESSEAEVPVVSTGTVETGKMEDQKVPLTEAGKPKVVDFGETNGTKPKDQATEADVPSIALMPPTPLIGHDEQRDLTEAKEPEEVDETRGRNSMEGFSIPGGWKDDVPTVTVAPASQVTQPTPEPSILPRTSSSEDSAATMTVTPIQAIRPPDPLSDIDEDTDDSAAFSDAFEDPSDFEDEGGFRSLDAIVESPLPSPMDTKKIPVNREVPESPSVKQAAKTPEIFDGSQPAVTPAVGQADLSADEEPYTQTHGANWQATTTYWSMLSKERRAQIEREAMSSDDEVRPPPVVSKKVKPKKTQTSARVSAADQDAALPTLRKTMRAQSGPTAASDDGIHIRSSMRTGGQLRPSSRDTSAPQRPQSAYVEQRIAAQKTATRPTSAGGPPVASVGAVKPVRPSPTTRFSDDSIYSQDTPLKKSPPKPKVEQPKVAQPKVSARLQKELAKADESDSESSFKKRRKAGSSIDTQGRYTMRTSMRGSSIDRASVPEPIETRPESPTSERTGRFGFRSLSPTFGRNKAGSVRDSSQDSGMRTSLRGFQSKGGKQGSQTGGMKSSLRGSTSNLVTQAPSKPSILSKAKSKSRFADSDDEDEAPRRTVFKSRFADSDDDSDPGSPRIARAELTPVRGIPRRKGQEDGDSTDLEEEDDNNPAERASKRFTGLIGPHPAAAEDDKVLAAARRNLGITEGASTANDVKEGDALQKGSLRQKAADESPQTTTKPADISFAPPDKKKRGFMSSILRRNRQSSSSVPQVIAGSPTRVPTSPVIAPATPQTPLQERPSSPIPAGAMSPKLSKQATPSSPAGPPPGKLIRKESYQMWLQRTNSELENAPASPGPNPSLMKLQERDLNDILLPLPPPTPDSPRPNVGARPNTSDGLASESIKLARSMRPDIAQRSQSGNFTRRVQIQAGEEGSEPGEREPKAIYSQKTGKKKKFGMLRRAFGLND